MSKPTVKNNPVLRSQQVLHAFTALVRPHLPLDLKNTHITADDIIAVLGYASVNRISMDAACHELKRAPSANRLREVLAAALPGRPKLQRSLNTLLRAQLPRCIKKGKRAYHVAIDLTLIPYHGACYENEKEIMRSQAKSGTTHFQGYATVSIVHNHLRYVVALRFVEKGESMQTLVVWLLNRLKTIGLRIKRAYFEKGFSAMPVLKTLARRKVSFGMPIPVRGKAGGVRKLFKASASYKTTYTFKSPKHGTWAVEAVAVKKYAKGRYKRRGVAWFAYAVAGLPASLPPHQIFEMYRLSFGIESSYRQMNQVRTRTTSRNPVIRLLFVGLAFVLFKLYIASRQQLAMCTKTASLPFSKLWLTLRRLARMLAQAVEHVFELADVVVRHAKFPFS